MHEMTSIASHVFGCVPVHVHCRPTRIHLHSKSCACTVSSENKTFVSRVHYVYCLVSDIISTGIVYNDTLLGIPMDFLVLVIKHPNS